MNTEKPETEYYLLNQLQNGFKPKWFITYHYKHPSENVRALRETNKPYGYQDRIGFKTYGDMWYQVSSYNNMERKRNSFDSLVEDTKQVKNVILKTLFGIKRPQHKWKYEFPPIFFFHEKGRVKLQYHTHLLLPDVQPELNDVDSIQDIFENTIRKSRKCFSRWKSIHVRPIDDPKKALSYVNKETSMQHNSFDYESSLLIHPENKCVV
mgnify:CR=1 FL=1